MATLTSAKTVKTATKAATQQVHEPKEYNTATDILPNAVYPGDIINGHKVRRINYATTCVLENVDENVKTKSNGKDYNDVEVRVKYGNELDEKTTRATKTWREGEDRDSLVIGNEYNIVITTAETVDDHGNVMVMIGRNGQEFLNKNLGQEERFNNTMDILNKIPD